MIDMKFGRWTVTTEPYIAKRQKVVDALCSCGKSKTVRVSSLRSGDSTSCGCYATELKIKRQSTKGGDSKHHLWQRWYDLNRRCYDPARKDYKHYGGRGLTVCTEWHKDNPEGFRNFLRDMEPTFIEGLEIDRIDNDGNYERVNCKWSTRSEQILNKRNLGSTIANPRWLDDGEDVLHLSAMAKKYKLSASILWDRLVKMGMTLQDALTRPVKVRKFILIFPCGEYFMKDVIKHPCHLNNEATRLGVTADHVLYLMFGDNITVEGVVNRQRVCFSYTPEILDRKLRLIKVNEPFLKFLKGVNNESLG